MSLHQETEHSTNYAATALLLAASFMPSVLTGCRQSTEAVTPERVAVEYEMTPVTKDVVMEREVSLVDSLRKLNLVFENLLDKVNEKVTNTTYSFQIDRLTCEERVSIVSEIAESQKVLEIELGKKDAPYKSDTYILYGELEAVKAIIASDQAIAMRARSGTSNLAHISKAYGHTKALMLMMQTSE